MKEDNRSKVGGGDFSLDSFYSTGRKMGWGGGGGIGLKCENYTIAGYQGEESHIWKLYH